MRHKVIYEVPGPAPVTFADLAPFAFFQFAPGNGSCRPSTGLRQRTETGYVVVDTANDPDATPVGISLGRFMSDSAEVIPLDVTITVHGPLSRETTHENQQNR